MAKKKKKSYKNIGLSFLILLIGCGVYYFYKYKQNEGIEVTIGKSSKGNITRIVTATGKIFPEIEVRISSEVAGEIVDLPVLDGMKIKEGDLLVRVNPDTLEAQVKQQEAAFNATKANAAQAKAQLLKAQLDIRRTQTLYDKGFSTEDTMDQMKTSLEIARASHEASLFRIKQQEMQLKEANDELNKASTFSPIEGTVIVLNSESGDRVVGTGQFAGTEIMRLANLNHMEVRVNVSEADIVEIKIGDPADIEVDALPDQSFEGMVTEIANSANTRGGGSQEQLTTFEVKVKLIHVDERYRPGMTATANIKTKTIQDVVKVPLQSLTVRTKDKIEAQLKDKIPADFTGKDSLFRVVFIRENNQAILTPVQTGLSDSKFIEISKGLKENVEIITGSYGALTRKLEHKSMIFLKKESKDSKQKKK